MHACKIVCLCIERGGGERREREREGGKEREREREREREGREKREEREKLCASSDVFSIHSATCSCFGLPPFHSL